MNDWWYCKLGIDQQTSKLYMMKLDNPYHQEQHWIVDRELKDIIDLEVLNGGVVS